MKKNINLILLMVVNICCVGLAQGGLDVSGNGLFRKNTGTTVDILNTNDLTNVLTRFGDNNTIKFSTGYNGNDGGFKISNGSALGLDAFTMSLSGNIGINTLFSDHLLLINHNSTGGTTGSAQLSLRSSSTTGFATVRFDNEGDDSYFRISAKATEGSSILNIHHDDGLISRDIMSMDGDDFRVGIHKTTPEAYLHLKQDNAALDVLAFVNASGADKWSMRVGDEDILIYYNNDIRGGFDVSTGNYNNFPPPPPLTNPVSGLREILALQPVKYEMSGVDRHRLALHIPGPDQRDLLAVNDRESLNYHQIAAMLWDAIRERHEIIKTNNQELENLKKRSELNYAKLLLLENKIMELGK